MKKLLSVLLCAVLLLGVCAPASAAEAPLLVVLGDSIAYGSGLSNPNKAVYGRIVAETNGYAYENYAVPGHTTQALLRRMETPAVKDAIGRADIISISIGGNNFLTDNLIGLLYDGIVTQDYTRMDSIAAGMYTDLCTVLQTIRALNPDTAVLLQTIYNPQTGYVGQVYAAGASRLNDAILAFAADHPGEVLVVDVAAVLTDPDTDFAEDRIHPSAAGNEKIAAAVLQTLYENGLGANTEPVINTPGKDLKGTGSLSFVVNFYGYFFHAIATVRRIIRR